MAPFPGWDANVVWDWSAEYTADFAPNEEPFGGFAAPFQSASLLSARDGEGNVIGTLTLAGEGIFEIDSSLVRLTASSLTR